MNQGISHLGYFPGAWQRAVSLPVTIPLTEEEAKRAQAESLNSG
jgi:hypothetical protein